MCKVALQNCTSFQRINWHIWIKAIMILKPFKIISYNKILLSVWLLKTYQILIKEKCSGFDRNPCLGEVVVKLDNLDLGSRTTGWYKLFKESATEFGSTESLWYGLTHHWVIQTIQGIHHRVWVYIIFIGAHALLAAINCSVFKESATIWIYRLFIILWTIYQYQFQGVKEIITHNLDLVSITNLLDQKCS